MKTKIDTEKINFEREVIDRQTDIDIVYNSYTHFDKRRKRDLQSKIKFNKLKDQKDE
jgi:hypothetical protein